MSETVMTLSDVTRVLIVLTDRCNARCSYCYQGGGGRRSIPLNAVRAAIDLALKAPSPETDIIFTGGEPLLEFDLLRKSVACAEECRTAGKRLRFRISTNGLLLSRQIADFLNERGFTVQLSFDGIARAQDYRAPGTFQILDRKLDSLRNSHPELFAERLRVSMLATPCSVPFLAASAAYFLRKGVRHIIIAPVLAHYSGWQTERNRELDDQLGAIADASLRHFGQTGEVPVVNFRQTGASISCSNENHRLCGGLRGTSLVVDVDGQVTGCPLFSDSCRDLSAGSAMSALRALRMGDVRESGLPERRTIALHAAQRLLRRGWEESRHSSYSKCGECGYFDDCLVCPLSLASGVDNPDSWRVPDFLCAFNQAVLKHRASFLAASGLSVEPDPIAPLEAYLRLWPADPSDRSDQADRTVNTRKY